LYQGSGLWTSDVAVEAARTTSALVALASAGHELTITGVPPGCGPRIGIDRDRDGKRDADELAAGTDPGDPGSFVAVGTNPSSRTGLQGVSPNPFAPSTSVTFTLARPGRVSLGVFDVLGRQVRTLAAGEMAAGQHRIRWDGAGDDGRAAGSGVYFVRLQVEGRRWTQSVIRVN